MKLYRRSSSSSRTLPDVTREDALRIGRQHFRSRTAVKRHHVTTGVAGQHQVGDVLSTVRSCVEKTKFVVGHFAAPDNLETAVALPDNEYFVSDLSSTVLPRPLSNRQFIVVFVSSWVVSCRSKKPTLR